MDLQLADQKEYPLAKGTRPQENRHHRPRSTDFSGNDSPLLIRPPGEISPILVVLQIVWDRSTTVVATLEEMSAEGVWDEETVCYHVRRTEPSTD